MGKGCRMCDELVALFWWVRDEVTGDCLRSVSCQPSGFTEARVHVLLIVRRWLIWWSLNSCKTSQGYMSQESVCGLEGEIRVLGHFSLLYLGLQTPIFFNLNVHILIPILWVIIDGPSLLYQWDVWGPLLDRECLHRYKTSLGLKSLQRLRAKTLAAFSKWDAFMENRFSQVPSRKSEGTSRLWILVSEITVRCF